jgi:hypothetical protein
VRDKRGFRMLDKHNPSSRIASFGFGGFRRSPPIRARGLAANSGTRLVDPVHFQALSAI